MMTTIYRGESLIDAQLSGDPQKQADRETRIRSVMGCLRLSLFPTKMLNGGDPYRIQKTGLLGHVVQHISAVYHQPRFSQTTHVLSFSSELEIAMRFGTAGGQLSSDAVDSGFHLTGATAAEVLDGGHVEYVVVSVDISNCVAVPGHLGAYVMTCSAKNRLLLINSLEYLSANKARAKDMAGFADAVGFAEAEAEWLILPIDLLEQPGARASLTALVPTTCAEVDVKAYVDPDFFIDGAGGSATYLPG